MGIKNGTLDFFFSTRDSNCYLLVNFLLEHSLGLERNRIKLELYMSNKGLFVLCFPLAFFFRIPNPALIGSLGRGDKFLSAFRDLFLWRVFISFAKFSSCSFCSNWYTFSFFSLCLPENKSKFDMVNIILIKTLHYIFWPRQDFKITFLLYICVQPASFLFIFCQMYFKALQTKNRLQITLFPPHIE